jgi:hypothetical protein
LFVVGVSGAVEAARELRIAKNMRDEDGWRWEELGSGFISMTRSVKKHVTGLVPKVDEDV